MGGTLDDRGRWEAILGQDGTDWIVMEMVDGPDLATLLQDGPLDVGLAMDYGRQVADGLAAAHAEGIIHRDLRTENVMVMGSSPATAQRRWTAARAWLFQQLNKE